MTGVQKIPWKRLSVEAAAIVASILLAFSIDAWWQQKMALKEADALIGGLYSDFQASQSHLEEWLAGNKRVLRATTEFLDALRGAAINDGVLVSHEWIVAAVGAPTYSPTDSSLEAAIASGQIELIENMDLRNTLARWRQQLDDTREDELLIREIVVNQLVPALAEQLRLGRAFEFDAMISWFQGQDVHEFEGEYRISAAAKIEGALAERVFYTTFVVGGLTDIHQTQAKILRLLEKHAEEN